MACNPVNKIPKKTVKTKPIIASFLFPLIIAWCVQVTVAPELNKTTVFNKGIENGFNGSTPLGGQTAPISTVGTKLLWKKAQKKEKNKQTSDKINKIIPYFSPCFTINVWWPWYVASLITSRHHTTIVITIITIITVSLLEKMRSTDIEDIKNTLNVVEEESRQ